MHTGLSKMENDPGSVPKEEAVSAFRSLSEVQAIVYERNDPISRFVRNQEHRIPEAQSNEELL